MHQYICIKIFILRANFEVSCGSYLYKGTLTFILLPLLNCDLFTLSVQILVTLSLLNCDLFTLSVQILATLSLLNCDLFTLSVQILVTLSLLNCDLFTLSVQILVTRHQKLCEGLRLDSPTYYCFGCIVDFVVLLVYYSVCVDRSGSLSGGAFNQLKLVTLSIVLTILYLLRQFYRGLCYSVSTLYISPTKSSNIYSRRPHCNIK